MLMSHYITIIHKYINMYYFVFGIYERVFCPGLIPFSFLFRLLFSSLFDSLLLRLYVFYECFTV